MVRVIHVIKASGVRFEFVFTDEDPRSRFNPTDDNILKALRANRRLFGTAAVKEKFDPALGQVVPHEDRAAGDVWDDPALVVAEVRVTGKDVTEIKRLKGPKPAEADPAPDAPTPEAQ